MHLSSVVFKFKLSRNLKESKNKDDITCSLKVHIVFLEGYKYVVKSWSFT